MAAQIVVRSGGGVGWPEYGITHVLWLALCVRVPCLVCCCCCCCCWTKTAFLEATDRACPIAIVPQELTSIAWHGVMASTGCDTFSFAAVMVASQNKRGARESLGERTISSYINAFPKPITNWQQLYKQQLSLVLCLVWPSRSTLSLGHLSFSLN